MRSMKAALLAILATACVPAVLAQRVNVPLIDTWSGGAVVNAYSATRGNTFTVSGGVARVTHLGYYDDGKDGLIEAHTVGLYTATGDLLRSATVPAGTVSSLTGNYRYAKLSSDITLTNNTTYIIAGDLGSFDKDHTPEGVSDIGAGDPAFRSIGSRFTPVSPLQFPDSTSEVAWTPVNLLAAITPPPFFTSSNPVGGLTGATVPLGAGQFVGARFQFANAVRLMSVSLEAGGIGTFFAALVPLASTNALPSGDSANGISFNPGEILDYRTFALSGPAAITPVQFSRILQPGSYGLVFGTGLFGTSGEGTVPTRFGLAGSTGLFWTNSPAQWANVINPGTSTNEFRITTTTTVESPAAASINLGFFAGINLTGTIGASYRVEYAEALEPNQWLSLGSVTLTNSPQLYIDATAAANKLKRFYRAVVAP